MSNPGSHKTSAEEDAQQNKYAAARLEGKSTEQAKAISGYSPNTSSSNIERIGGPVHTKIVQALEAKGITDDFLATQYQQGIEASQRIGAREKDLHSHAQYLSQIGFLMGYAKNTPSVAVQINNTTSANQGDDADTIAELLRLVGEEIELRQSGEVHEANSGIEDSASHTGMVITVAEIPESDGRGQP